MLEFLNTVLDSLGLDFGTVFRQSGTEFPGLFSYSSGLNLWIIFG